MVECTNFPGKAKSTVWKYFGFWKIIKQDAPSDIMKDKAVCKLCKAEYKYNRNTTNLSQHLSNFTLMNSSKTHRLQYNKRSIGMKTPLSPFLSLQNVRKK